MTKYRKEFWYENWYHIANLRDLSGLTSSLLLTCSDWMKLINLALTWFTASLFSDLNHTWNCKVIRSSFCSLQFWILICWYHNCYLILEAYSASDNGAFNFSLAQCLISITIIMPKLVHLHSMHLLCITQGTHILPIVLFIVHYLWITRK